MDFILPFLTVTRTFLFRSHIFALRVIYLINSQNKACLLLITFALCSAIKFIFHYDTITNTPFFFASTEYSYEVFIHLLLQ